MEVTDNWDRWLSVAAGAEVPLEVADPEDEVGDDGGAGVDLGAEELVRVDSEAGVFECLLGLAERDEGFEDFAFEALHVFEGDVEEVAGATGGIQDACVAELAMEVQRGVDGLLGVAGVDEVGDGGDGVVPVGAKWLNEDRGNEAFDVSAGCVVRAEGVTFGGVEGAFEECSEEDGGFDVAPVGVGGIMRRLS